MHRLDCRCPSFQTSPFAPACNNNPSYICSELAPNVLTLLELRCSTGTTDVGTVGLRYTGKLFGLRGEEWGEEGVKVYKGY